MSIATINFVMTLDFTTYFRMPYESATTTVYYVKITFSSPSYNNVI